MNKLLFSVLFGTLVIISIILMVTDINKEISDKYDLLKGHIDRLQKSAKKYGGK